MNILLVTVGSSGDVHPFVGLGIRLRARGHRVTLITDRYFQPLIESVGLDFVDGAPEADFVDLLQNRRLWNPIRGFRLVMREAVVPRIRPIYQAISERVIPGQTVVVASSLAFGARIAQEKLHVPLATVHLSPAQFRSDFQCPALPVMYLPDWLPRPLKRGQFWLADTVMVDPSLVSPLNAFRAELGLRPVRRIMADWWHSPQRVFGLFPGWFAPRQPDWPSQLMLTGFPLYDERGVSEPDAELVEFVTGEAPLVFTPGSANVHSREFFTAAVDACRLLGRRGLLLTRHPDQLPALPTGIKHVSYAPFSWLLPRSAALIHHGGIGSMAQALAAGVPQLLMPMGFDQFDNAARIRRLGVGESLSPRAFRGLAVAGMLRGLLESKSVRTCCRNVAMRFQGQDPLENVCSEVERLVEH